MSLKLFFYESEESTGLSSPRFWSFRMLVTSEADDFEPDGRRRNVQANVSETLPMTILSTANRDRSGLFPRGVRVRWTEETPVGYKDGGHVFVPVFRRDRYQEYKIGDRVSFLGGVGIIVGKLPETLRS